MKTEFEKEMQRLKDEYLLLANRLPNQMDLSLEDAAQFYSSWHYIAARLFSSIPTLQTAKAQCEKLGINEKQLKQIVEFLLRTGLCVRAENGHIEYGPTHMHLSSEHPLIAKHHSNWRIHAMEKIEMRDHSRELSYSGVLALSKEDAFKIRVLLPQWIDQIRAMSDPSPSETVFCLNLDWFEI